MIKEITGTQLLMDFLSACLILFNLYGHDLHKTEELQYKDDITITYLSANLEEGAKVLT